MGGEEIKGLREAIRLLLGKVTELESRVRCLEGKLSVCR